MTEENKYFTPNIEDIHVGYECEFTLDLLAFEVNNFDDIEVGKLEIGSFKNIVRYYEVGLMEGLSLEGVIRTPYLTKEQIEVEGWKTITSDYEPSVKYFQKNNYNFVYNFDKRRVIFMIRDPSIIETKVWKEGYQPLTFNFQCECPSINEFRKICKMLGI